VLDAAGLKRLVCSSPADGPLPFGQEQPYLGAKQ
jgi:hypothetical protein